MTCRVHLPATVETRGVISQLEEDFFHLERSRKSFDENSSTDCVMGHANVRLREEEDVVPETRLEVVLHLGQVKVWTSPRLDEFLCIVIEVESKIKDGARDGRIVDSDTRFVEMPAARTRPGVRKHRLV